MEIAISKGHVAIRDWQKDEQPREKLRDHGAGTLSNAELIAILLGTGTPSTSAVDLAKNILDLADNNLNQLGRLDIKELQKVKGIGEAKAITIMATMELSRRRHSSELPTKPKIGNSKDAADILMPLLCDLNHEMFYVLYLSQSNKVEKREAVSSGGRTSTVVDSRMILKNALLYNANRIVLAHNHPSGSLKPSQADISLTHKIKDAAALMDISLLDHLIIAHNNYFSMADEGII
ncbi:RadC family protein [Taibaiella soli]|uniref:MPN domain-containing protein n=1 Tax=Taibaiella soli TaxID=1649169 RepID=A0A2W2BX28_9BACT|nr:DNA repair protein RadC [Taibaiella soli]PZF72413.1 hypothetical protein DN068_13755 [Taibaiella soli]